MGSVTCVVDFTAQNCLGFGWSAAGERLPPGFFAGATQMAGHVNKVKFFWRS
jgi:hypothetical protein